MQVELTSDAVNGFEAVLASVPGIFAPAREGRFLRARAEHGASALPALVTALERQGLAVASATVSRPSLDDVYLRYAGRSFDQADEERKEAA